MQFGLWGITTCTPYETHPCRVDALATAWDCWKGSSGNRKAWFPCSPCEPRTSLTSQSMRMGTSLQGGRKTGGHQNLENWVMCSPMLYLLCPYDPYVFVSKQYMKSSVKLHQHFFLNHGMDRGCKFDTPKFSIWLVHPCRCPYPTCVSLSVSYPSPT